MFKLFHKNKKKEAKKTMNIEDMTTEEIQQYLASREQKEPEKDGSEEKGVEKDGTEDSVKGNTDAVSDGEGDGNVIDQIAQDADIDNAKNDDNASSGEEHGDEGADTALIDKLMQPLLAKMEQIEARLDNFTREPKKVEDSQVNDKLDTLTKRFTN